MEFFTANMTLKLKEFQTGVKIKFKFKMMGGVH